MAPSDDPERPLAAAVKLDAGEWQLDAEPDAAELEAEIAAPPVAPPTVPMQFPKSVAEPAAPPPSPLQIVEAMLFIGGPPLTAEKACAAIRGLTPERFRELVDELGRT
jgi:segregation and condensation protein B